MSTRHASEITEGARRRRGGIVAVCAAALLSLVVIVSTMPTAGAEEPGAGVQSPAETSTTTIPPATEPTVVAPPAAPPALSPVELWAKFVELYRSTLPPAPAGSGAGRRIVYSIGQQRVWLIGNGDVVEFSYLVSGRAGLPALGSYRIFSKSRFASSGSVRMQYMMRFAHGRRLAIGFHSIPVRGNGTMLQTVDQLGTFRSHGCVRQRIDQAELAWDWAPVGTPVVVVR